jgi:hypothetical protein
MASRVAAPLTAPRRARLRLPAILAALASALASVAASAAERPAPGNVVVPRPRPAATAVVSGGAGGPPSAASYAPAAPPGTGTPRGRDVALYLVARLTEDGEPVSAGMTWRLFGQAPDETGKLPLVASAIGGDAEFRVPPGTYLVHATFGKAGSISRVVLDRDVVSETVLLNAGGMKLDVVVDEDEPVPPDTVAFDVYSSASGGGRAVLAENLKPGTILRLAAGTYHVVSRYGAVNAVLKADIEVQPGKLTEATLHHRAAKVTLKLVSEEGGEALANTQWSVLSPGGDVVVEDIGAFPSFVLAEGDYSVVAKNGGKIFNGTFHVEPGRDRDVEVMAKETAGLGGQ